jgi:hypothetical protein
MQIQSNYQVLGYNNNKKASPNAPAFTSLEIIQTRLLTDGFKKGIQIQIPINYMEAIANSETIKEAAKKLRIVVKPGINKPFINYSSPKNSELKSLPIELSKANLLSFNISKNTIRNRIVRFLNTLGLSLNEKGIYEMEIKNIDKPETIEQVRTLGIENFEKFMQKQDEITAELKKILKIGHENLKSNNNQI